MELAVLTIFGVGAWWAVAVGDSDDENEYEAAGGRSGRRREVVDVTADRRLRAHEAMVRIPKPGYLIVKADIVKGSDATDEMLEMCPAVQQAWAERVIQNKLKEKQVKKVESEEEKLEMRSVFDDISDWVKERVSKHPPMKGRKAGRAFDYGALILGEESTTPIVAAGGGGGGEVYTSNESHDRPVFDTIPAIDVPTKQQGSCVICFDENPKYRACFLPCGHASMCYGCALDAAITQSGACPMCRTRLAVIATYDALELVHIPSSELAALKHRTPIRKQSGAAEELIDTTPTIDISTVHDTVKSNKTNSFSNVETLLSKSEGEGMTKVMSEITAHVETELCWVARVNGPKGMIIDYLTEEDLQRRM